METTGRKRSRWLSIPTTLRLGTAGAGGCVVGRAVELGAGEGDAGVALVEPVHVRVRAGEAQAAAVAPAPAAGRRGAGRWARARMLGASCGIVVEALHPLLLTAASSLGSDHRPVVAGACRPGREGKPSRRRYDLVKLSQRRRVLARARRQLRERCGLAARRRMPTPARGRDCDEGSSGVGSLPAASSNE